MTYNKVLLNITNCQTPINTIYANQSDDAIVKSNIETIFPFIDFTTNKWSYGFNNNTHIIIYYYNSPCIWIGIGNGSDFGVGIGGNASHNEYIYSSYYGYLSCEMYDNGAMILARTMQSSANVLNAEVAVYPPISENLTDNDFLYGGIVKFVVSQNASGYSSLNETSGYILTQNTNTLRDANLFTNSFVTKREVGAASLWYNYALTDYTPLETIGLVELIGTNANHEIGVIGQNQIYGIVTMPTTIKGCKYIKFRDTAWRIVYGVGNSNSDASHDTWNKNTPMLLFNTGEAFTSTGDVTV